MLRRCYLVPTHHGDAVFIEREKAIAYATKWHSYVVNMIGQDGQAPPSSTPVVAAEYVPVDVDVTSEIVGA